MNPGEIQLSNQPPDAMDVQQFQNQEGGQSPAFNNDDETPKGVAYDPATGTVTLPDGQRYTTEQLTGLVSMGNDYTRKTQELAAQRQALEGKAGKAAGFVDYFSNQPAEIQDHILGIIQKIEAEGIAPTAPGQGNPLQPLPPVSMLQVDIQNPLGLDRSDFSVGEQSILDAANKVIGDLMKNQAQVVDQLMRMREVAPTLNKIQQDLGALRGDTEATAAAERLSAEFGMKISPKDVRDAQAASGVNDLEAAWLVRNRGVLANRPARPNVPGAGGKPNLDISQMGASEIAQLARQGLVSVEN